MRLLAFDPAKNTGWARYDTESGVLTSGEIKLKMGGDEIYELIAEAEVHMLVVEDGFASDRPGRKNIKQYGDHSKRVGGLVMAVRQQHRSCRRIWIPKPNQWRAALRGAGHEMAFGPRGQCKKDSLAIARGLGRPCVGPRGGGRDDEADAICLVVAGCFHWGLRFEVSDD